MMITFVVIHVVIHLDGKPGPDRYFGWYSTPIPIPIPTHRNYAVCPLFNRKVLQWPRAGTPGPIHVPLEGEGGLRVFCPLAHRCQPLLTVTDADDLFRAFHSCSERD